MYISYMYTCIYNKYVYMIDVQEGAKAPTFTRNIWEHIDSEILALDHQILALAPQILVLDSSSFRSSSWSFKSSPCSLRFSPRNLIFSH